MIWVSPPFLLWLSLCSFWELKQLNLSFILQVKYKEDFHKTKDKYTTVTETADSERVNNLKNLFSNVSVSVYLSICLSIYLFIKVLLYGIFVYFVHSICLKINVQTWNLSKLVVALCISWMCRRSCISGRGHIF